MKTLTYDPSGGEHIIHASTEATRIARHNKSFVRFSFNELSLIAAPKKSPTTLVWEFETELDRRHNTVQAGISRRRREALQAEQNRGRQSMVDFLIDRLPERGKTLDGLVEWIMKFTPLADWIGITFDRLVLIETFRSFGHESNKHVGQEPEWFNTRQRIGEYIAGQVINCLEHGGAPHPMAVSFCEKYFRLPPSTIIHQPFS